MSIPKTLKFVNIVVAQNQSLSAAVDLDGYKLVGIIAPAAIEATTTNFSLAASPTSGGTYGVVKPDGAKLSKPFLVNDYITFSNLAEVYGIRFVKLQLETAAGVAVAQATASRTFQLVLDLA